MFLAVGILVFAEATGVSAANGVVMTVNDTEYTDFIQGWQYAVSTAKTNTPVLVKLYADWLPNMADMLTSGDKVMLWYDEVHCVPICSALTLK